MNASVADRMTDPDVIENPYDYYDELREKQSVYFSQSMGGYLVTRYKDVSHVLRHPEIFASRIGDENTAQANFDEKYRWIYDEAGVPICIATLQAADGDIHRRFRQSVDETFTAFAVEAMRPDIQKRIHALVDAFANDGKADLYQTLCIPLPLYVMCDLIGFPHELTPVLQRSAHAMTYLAMPNMADEEERIRLHRDQAVFNRAVLDVVRKRRAQPDETLMSKLIRTPTNDGSYLSDQEIVSIVMVLNVGGNETTTNGLGNMFHLLLSQPGVQDELRRDRKLVDRFVEEALRLQSPVSLLPRWVLQDTEIDGVPIPAHSVVYVSYAAANRDSGQFACPYAIDYARDGLRNHLAFGRGPHFCLGAALSRCELSYAMNIVLDRLDNIRLDPSAPPPRHQTHLAVRALQSLPIVFDKKA